MDVNEMSTEFDVLYNQINSNQAPGVDEYEKSVFLTKAQDEIIKMYFDPRGNKFQLGMDLGARRQYDFSTLIKWENCDVYSGYDYTPYDSRAALYMLPNDCFLVLNESVEEPALGNGRDNLIYQIIPITFIDYTRLMLKPYKYPTKYCVWRIITNFIPEASRASSDSGDGDPGDDSQDVAQTAGTIVEIIGRFRDKQSIEYKIRYVRKPRPIVLVDLTAQQLTVDGVNEISPCELPEGVHHEIVQRAAELATAIYNPSALGNMIGIGNVSETNMGVVPSNNTEK